MIEQWRDVVGYEGHYQVSDHGRIKSVARNCISGKGGIRRIKAFIKKPQFDSRGNTLVIGVCKEGKMTQRQIGQIVLEAFVGPRPDKARVIYADGNRENVALPNLSWGPDHRTVPRLTQEQAQEVREALAVGVTSRELADKYNVAQSTIVAIGNNQRYKTHTQGVNRGTNHQQGTAQHQNSLDAICE